MQIYFKEFFYLFHWNSIAVVSHALPVWIRFKDKRACSLKETENWLFPWNWTVSSSVLQTNNLFYMNRSSWQPSACLTVKTLHIKPPVLNLGSRALCFQDCKFLFSSWSGSFQACSLFYRPVVYFCRIILAFKGLHDSILHSFPQLFSGKRNAVWVWADAI